MKRVIYAGSFDPFTLGHLDIIKRSLGIADNLIIAVGENIRKKYLFSLDERIEMIKNTLKSENLLDNSFEVKAFDNLLVDFAEKEEATILIRGVRSLNDFDYEFQMGMTNQDLNSKVETVFLLPKKDYMFVSSSMVRELAFFKKDISKYVPTGIFKAFKNKFNE